MKEHNVKLTLQETEQLCRLYMDCRLSVLEETELQYVLGMVPYSSPCIDEVRMLMGVSTTLIKAKKTPKKWYFRFSRKAIVSIAASIAILVAVGVSLFRNGHITPDSALPNDNNTYIAAYSHGERLNGADAITATDMAMAKADSLMQYASLAERDYMMKAHDIISLTINE